jgi:hypothetical protein
MSLWPKTFHDNVVAIKPADWQHVALGENTIMLFARDRRPLKWQTGWRSAGQLSIEFSPRPN